MKRHLVLHHEGYLPHYAVISNGKTADVKVAKQMAFAPGTILVMDRGYGGGPGDHIHHIY